MELRQRVEQAAQRAVEDWYRDQGYTVEDVSHLNLGWDLHAHRSGVLLRVEVKGRSGPTIAAELTPKEYRPIKGRDPNYRICVVTGALDPGLRRIHEFQLAPRGDVWVSSDGRVLNVEVIEAARVHA